MARIKARGASGVVWNYDSEVWEREEHITVEVCGKELEKIISTNEFKYILENILSSTDFLDKGDGDTWNYHPKYHDEPCLIVTFERYNLNIEQFTSEDLLEDVRTAIDLVKKAFEEFKKTQLRFEVTLEEEFKL